MDTTQPLPDFELSEEVTIEEAEFISIEPKRKPKMQPGTPYHMGTLIESRKRYV